MSDLVVFFVCRVKIRVSQIQTKMTTLYTAPEGGEVGYKIFNGDFKCLGYQYEVGKTCLLYDDDGNALHPKVCSRGFHYCLEAIDCLAFYDMLPSYRYAQVRAFGFISHDTEEEEDNTKRSTNKLLVEREISFEEWQKICTCIKVDKDGTKCHFVGGKQHREDDLPAIEHADGGKEYYINDKRHRDNDKPAVEYTGGTLEWWVDGKRHRDGGKPAIVYPNGDRQYYEHGWRLANPPPPLEKKKTKTARVVPYEKRRSGRIAALKSNINYSC